MGEVAWYVRGSVVRGGRVVRGGTVVWGGSAFPAWVVQEWYGGTPMLE